MSEKQSTNNNIKQNGIAGFIQAAGVILAISYPVLALSTGVRAIYQLVLLAIGTRTGSYLPPSLSAVAALAYLTATIGFAYRQRWSWRLSVAVLAVETLLTLIVGTLSFIIPDVIGSTVWRHFGADYGYFPLIQPLLGLAWLFHPETLKLYKSEPKS
ncbi:MAG: hypothetical protein Kow0080_06410 [Candidatus Promineifilaceae bacterium]